MSKLNEVNRTTSDYAWNQFLEMRHMNKLMDELYSELHRLNNTFSEKCECTEYEDDYETDDDD